MTEFVIAGAKVFDGERLLGEIDVHVKRRGDKSGRRIAAVRRALDLVLDHDARQLYVGHGGPNVCADDVRRRIDSIAPLG